MTSGVARRTPSDAPAPSTGAEHPAVVSNGRPPWWAVALALALAIWLTLDLVTGGITEQVDVWVADLVGHWDLRDSSAYTPIYWVTRIGARPSMEVWLFAVVAWLAGRHRTLLPLARLLLASVLLFFVVYGIKWGIGRTAPEYVGQYLYHPDGLSFPSGHMANAVLLWGVLRWQAVEYGMPAWVQRLLWALAVIGPVLTAVSMILLNFHWVSDALMGAAVGFVLLGVVHRLDGPLLARWVDVRWRRPSS